MHPRLATPLTKDALHCVLAACAGREVAPFGGNLWAVPLSAGWAAV
ncbi:hypothetical protein [Rhodoferax sp.]|nr:hypothetical protein [Rhodoferax sp.]MBE0472753.1 hypothetical protein [Rhodoferax sp.]